VSMNTKEDPLSRKGSGATTIRHVARLAKVALGTVSRVVNNHASVSPDVRERVLDAIRELGYQPDAVAQSMRLRTTRTVACAIRDISIAGFGSFVKAAEEVLRDAGYTLLLTNTDEQPAREIELLRTFAKRRVDGVIMTVSDEGDDDLLRTIQEMRVPLVLMDRDVALDVDVVAIDHRGGARAATAHLLELGHRRIALLTGLASMRPAHERIAGFQEAHRRAGAAPQPDLVRYGSFSAEFGFEQLTLLLDADEPPTAVIAGGMTMLPGVLHAIAARGLQVPGDISVIAGGDSDLAGLIAPPVTAVRWNNADWGRHAVRLLLDRIERHYDADPRRVILPTELVQRASCAPPSAAPRPRVPRAAQVGDAARPAPRRAAARGRG
jgi:LacI family transcriptional regulator